MHRYQPSRLLNSLEYIGFRYGLSLLDKSVPGELNMSFPTDDPKDPRDSSLVRIARQSFYDEVGIPISRVAKTNLGNGSRVLVVRKSHAASDLEQNGQDTVTADALITQEPGMALRILYADCAPIFLVDPVNPAIGLIHAGWRGTLSNVVGETIDAMSQNFGTIPSNLVAYIGPTICMEHYPIDYSKENVEVIEGFYEETGVQAAAEPRGDKIHCDIQETNRRILEAIRVEQVEASSTCTFEDSNQPSARRDDPQLEGPFRSNAMAVVVLTE